MSAEAKKNARAPKVPPDERLRVRVRAGGRCVFCGDYLLESELTLRPVFLGEVAHNIDAAYVALAEALQCTLVTADTHLANPPQVMCPIEVLHS